MKLTAPAVEKVKAGPGERIEFFDASLPGFGLRVNGPTATNPHGHKSWIVFYRFDGKQRRLTLEPAYPQLGLAEARRAAGEIFDLVRAGKDPAEERAAKAAEQKRRPVTVSDLADEYLKRWASKKRSGGEDERMLRKDVLPAIGGRPLAAVARRDIVELLDRIVDRGAPVQANRVLAVTRRMFNFAVERGLLETTPCVKIKAPAAEQARERHLRGEEIPAFWFGLDRSPMERNIRRALRFMLVTGQRKGEVIGLHKREINRADCTWLIPADRSKNKREHVVPLTPLAIEILDEIEPGDGGWIFPSERTGEPYREQSIDHAVRDLYAYRRPPTKNTRPLVLDGFEPFTPHDLRRTASTGMRELGVSKDDVKLVLNHTDGTVTGRHYDRYEGLREKKRALELWASYLGELLRPGAANVVQLRA
jgi:integrase